MNKMVSSGGQMSDSMLTMVCLTLSGGLQDAYSYFVRGKVFANAQTGNVVLMSQHLFAGEWADSLRYLIPLTAFVCGVFAAEEIRGRFWNLEAVHWRQIVAVTEIILLFCVGLLPHSMDSAANAITSFACAMQVQAFRKVDGYAVASTMCIGNMRSGVEALSRYRRTGEREMLRKATEYIGVILVFALGAGAGSRLLLLWGRQTIWINCVLLLFTVLLMMIPEHEKEEKV